MFDLTQDKKRGKPLVSEITNIFCQCNDDLQIST